MDELRQYENNCTPEWWSEVHSMCIFQTGPNAYDTYADIYFNDKDRHRNTIRFSSLENLLKGAESGKFHENDGYLSVLDLEYDMPMSLEAFRNVIFEVRLSQLESRDAKA